MRLKKALRHLYSDLTGYGLVQGTRVLALKKGRKGAPPTRVHVPKLGGTVWVRPASTDLAILDQIALSPYLPLDPHDPPATIVDLGANIGLSTLYFKMAYPKARIVAVEPDAANFAMLQRNTERLAGVRCVQAAIWPTDGWIDLERDGLGSSGFRANANSTGSGDTRALSIPTLMREHDLDRIDLLKVDIEGGEMDLFTAPDIKWLEQVEKISLEPHDHIRPGATQAFFKFLSGSGWNVEVYNNALMCRRQHC